MKRYQLKGMRISILFLIADGLLGGELGRILWICLVLFLVISGTYYSVWIIFREASGKQE